MLRLRQIEMFTVIASLVLASGMIRAHGAQVPDGQLAAHQHAARDAEARQDFATAVREYAFLRARGSR